MTQEEFNQMLAVAIAGQLGGGTYISKYSGEEIDAAVGAGAQGPIIKNGTWWTWSVDHYVDTGVLATADLADASVTTPKLADGAVTWSKLAQEARKSNPNLLDNWYFVGGGSQQGGGQFPINQRGLTTLSENGVFIDRWNFVKFGEGSVSLDADGLTISETSGTGSNYLTQFIEPGLVSSLAGKTLTVSLLYRGTGTGFGNLYVNIGGKPWPGARINLILDGRVNLSTFTVTAPSTIPSVQYNELATIECHGGSITCMAVKSELAPHKTLAHQDTNGNWVLNDPPPNFEEELAKCQRYFERVYLPLCFALIPTGENRLSANIIYKVRKRATPTIIRYPLLVVRASDNLPVYGTSSPELKLPAETAADVDGCLLLFPYAQDAPVSAGNSAYLRTGFGVSRSYIDISSDL